MLCLEIIINQCYTETPEIIIKKTTARAKIITYFLQAWHQIQNKENIQTTIWGWVKRSWFCSEESSTDEEMDRNKQRFGLWVEKSRKKFEKFVSSYCFLVSATNVFQCKSAPSVMSTNADIWWLELCIYYIQKLYKL